MFKFHINRVLLQALNKLSRRQEKPSAFSSIEVNSFLNIKSLIALIHSAKYSSTFYPLLNTVDVYRHFSL
jgi:hypothetical protein